jgi:hypothetical protein
VIEFVASLLGVSLEWQDLTVVAIALPICLLIIWWAWHKARPEGRRRRTP